MKKTALRQEYLAKRQTLSVEEVRRRNVDITLSAEKLLSEIPFQFLHTFLPQRNKNEVDTWRIISSVSHLFSQTYVVVPYVIPGTREMQHYILDSQTKLIENKWGIPEPDPDQSAPIEIQLIDIVLVPLLTFDKRGYRAGYGGGYYDRFLAKCKPEVIKIGFCFFEPVEMIEDIDQYDVRLDYCVTPGRVWHW